MKREPLIIKAILMLFIIIVQGFTLDNSYTITPGIGIDKIIVGQTRLSDLFLLIGKNDEFTQGIIDGKKRVFFINRYIYTNLGLTIVTHTEGYGSENLENPIIDNIIVQSPANAETIGNILLGIDEKEKIISVLGKPDNDRDIYSTVTYFHYRQKGISFGINDETKKIKSIEVYRKNGSPEKQ
jgi:hypothetical protein